MSYYNFAEKIKNEEMTKIEQEEVEMKVSLLRSNFEMDNLRIVERKFKENDFNWFFRIYYSP
jgi:hypothetical protein